MAGRIGTTGTKNQIGHQAVHRAGHLRDIAKMEVPQPSTVTRSLFRRARKGKEEREREEGRVAGLPPSHGGSELTSLFNRETILRLETDGHSPIHAHHSFALEPIFLLDASKLIQRKARDGRALAQGISRPSQNARRYQAFYRENRTGDGQNGDQELAPSYEVLGQGEETPAGSHRPKTCPTAPFGWPIYPMESRCGRNN